MSTRMQLSHCDREQEVVDALRSGRWATAWGEDIRKHVAACTVCAEVALVAREFQREAELAQGELGQPGASLPSAGLVWWKAQLAARRAAEQRATAPIAWTERAALVLAAFTVIMLGTWQWPQIAAWFQAGTFAPPSRLFALPDFSNVSEWLRRLATAWTSQAPTILLVGVATAFLTLLALAAYLVWQED